MAASVRQKVRQPGWWWAWSVLPASLGLLLGLAPVNRGEIACGAPLLQTGSCEEQLTVRMAVALALLGVALVMVVVGLMVTDLSVARSCLCIVSIVVFALGSYVALRALTLEGGGSHCNMVLTRSASDRARGTTACDAFWSQQLWRTLWASAGMALDASLVYVSARVGRPRRVPTFVPHQNVTLS